MIDNRMTYENMLQFKIDTQQSEITRLRAALEAIASLPLGHHDAKKIAKEALQLANPANRNSCKLL